MEDTIVGIDIGTSKVCTVIGYVNKANQIEVLGRGLEYFNGIKKGIIVDIESTANAIKSSVRQAEEMANLRVGSAFVNILGAHVSFVESKTSINISNENREVTQSDIKRLLTEAQNVSIPEDRQVIDVIPRQYIIDGYDEIIDPLGMVGTKLELDSDVVAGRITSVQNIVKSLGRANISIEGLVVEALANSEIALTHEEKEMGVTLIDVGGGITEISVFKNKNLMFYDTILVGGDHISNDISVGLKILYQDAEKIKKEYELALTSLIKNDQEVTVNDLNENKSKTIKISEIVEIIEARVQEVFLLCKKSLNRAGLDENYFGSIVLTGAGISYVDGAKQIANEVFDVPIRVENYKSDAVPKVEYSTATGIIKYINNMHKLSKSGCNLKPLEGNENKNGEGIIKKILKIINDLF